MKRQVDKYPTYKSFDICKQKLAIFLLNSLCDRVLFSSTKSFQKVFSIGSSCTLFLFWFLDDDWLSKTPFFLSFTKCPTFWSWHSHSLFPMTAIEQDANYDFENLSRSCCVFGGLASFVVQISESPIACFHMHFRLSFLRRSWRYK